MGSGIASAGQGDLEQLADDAREEETRWRTLLDEIRSLPANSQDERAVNRLLQQAAAKFEQAYAARAAAIVGDVIDLFVRHENAERVVADASAAALA